MKPLPKFLCTRPRRQPQGFTLVELLVAIAVLGVLLLTLAQIFGLMNTTFLYGVGKVNNFTKARAMLNILENDFRSAIFRPDLPAFPTAGTVEFYTSRAGVSSGAAVRNVSLVKYALMQTAGTATVPPTSTLQRFDAPLEWTDPAAYIGFGTSTGFPVGPTLTPRDTAPGVVAFQVLFVQSDGTFSTNTFTPAVTSSGAAQSNPTRGIGVTLAVVDDQAMRMLTSTQLSSLSSGFASAVTGNQNVKADWDQYLNTGLTWSQYPKSLGTGIGIYECYLSVP